MVKSILYVVSQLPWKIFYNDSPETSFYQKEKGNKKKKKNVVNVGLEEK